jgi:hypothetical protein
MPAELPSCPFRAEEMGNAPGTMAAYSVSLEGVRLPAVDIHSPRVITKESSMAQVRRVASCSQRVGVVAQIPAPHT